MRSRGYSLYEPGPVPVDETEAGPFARTPAAGRSEPRESLSVSVFGSLLRPIMAKGRGLGEHSSLWTHLRPPPDQVFLSVLDLPLDKRLITIYR